MTKICVIPARGGSKRIPKKNIRSFLGRPIISYSITAALEANIFDRVIVSTDSEEIAAVAREYGAEIPFMRDPALADDFTSTHTVAKDAAQRCFKVNSSVDLASAQSHFNQAHESDFLCCLYATAPLVSSHYLKQGLADFKASSASMAYSVTQFDFPILRSVRIDEQTGLTHMFWPEHERKRSQDLPKAYHDAGQFYWYRVKNLLQGEQMSFNGSVPVLLPAHLVQDIDTEEDWKMAELKYQSAFQ